MLMKNQKIKSLLLCASLFACSLSYAQANRDANANADAAKDGYSDLWGKNGENWTPASRLPDFSFAGFDMGDSSIPNFPVRARLGDGSAKPNDDKDDADELQRLINTIERPGVILIPRGRWNIGKRITIRQSGIVLRGEDGAEFKMDKSLRDIDGKSSGTKDYAFNDAFFLVKGKTGRLAKKKITANADKGANQIIVEPNVTYQTGDMIEINQTDSNDQSLFKELHGTNQVRDLWYGFNASCRTHRTLHKQNIFRFFAKVVSQEGNRVTINRTLPLRLALKWSPRINKVDMGMDKTTQNIGFDNLTIRMNGESFAGHFTLDGSSFIDMRSVFNSWIRDVNIIDADNGINVRDTYFSLFDSIRFEEDKRVRGRTGHHALWFRSASDNLSSNLTFNTVYLHDISVELQARQNVFSKIVGENITLDHHRASPFANLFTEIDVGKGTLPITGGGAACVGPHTAAFTTFWNIKKDTDFDDLPHRTKHDGRLKQNAKDWNYAHSVGLKGLRLSRKSKSFGQFVEFSFGEKLKNPNLYTAQVNKRFGRSSTGNEAPKVSLTSPLNNQVFTLGDTITLAATASDSDGTVKRIRFNADDNILRYDNTAPYSHSFIPDAAGTYKILANARDNDNKESEDYVSISVVASAVAKNNIVHIAKNNAPDFALDGGIGAAINQTVYLWKSDLNNVNQQWVEIDRGNNYYSYQKLNTDFCLDAGRGGARNQNVKLWLCRDTNQNQHFKKISASNGAVRLQKRNAPGYSVDGSHGGENAQNVKLWENRPTQDSNQHWRFTKVGESSQ